MIRLRSASPGQAHILMVGGGSAGHVAPMVAVAEAVRDLEPGARVTFVCSDRASDGAFLAMEHETYRTLPLPRRSFASPMRLLRGFVESARILKRDAPDVVFSKGGAVSVPMCLAARLRGIPIVVHESDAVMGAANRVVSSFATTVLRGIEIGNPIRTRIMKGKKEEGLRITGLSGTRPILLVMGGSQGALTINQTVARRLDELLAVVDVIHLTGEGKSVAERRAGYFATEFGSDALPHFYACADLALSRAGASSIAELEACGIASILVPLEGLAGNHQVKNAEAAAARGAIHLPQERLDAELVSLVRSLVERKGSVTGDHRARYAPAAEAARLIAETVLQSVARKKRDA